MVLKKLYQDIGEVYLENLKSKETETERMVKTRLNQGFFGTVVMANYDTTYCITGLKTPQMLEAAHIVSWKNDVKNRINPQNGLCLNRLHRKAFDEGYFTIMNDFSIQVSKYLDDFEDSMGLDFLKSQNEKTIKTPIQFMPKVEFLTYHQEHIFLK